MQEVDSFTKQQQQQQNSTGGAASAFQQFKFDLNHRESSNSSPSSSVVCQPARRSQEENNEKQQKQHDLGHFVLHSSDDMTGCGSCPSCSQGVPICVGNVCVAPEQAFVQGSFIFATFATCFNFFVARREAVKKQMSQNMRMIVFVVLPVIFFAMSVQLGYIEIPTMKAIQNSIFGAPEQEDAEVHHGHGHNHTHGHAEWHTDQHGHQHLGHFHHDHGHDGSEA